MKMKKSYRALQDFSVATARVHLLQHFTHTESQCWTKWFIFYFFSRFHDRFFSTESRGQYIEACTTIHFPLELRIICYNFCAQGIFPSSFSFCLLRATNIFLMMWDHRTTHFRPWKIIICLIFRKHVIHLVRGENLIALKSWNLRLDSPLCAVWKACLY